MVRNNQIQVIFEKLTICGSDSRAT